MISGIVRFLAAGLALLAAQPVWADWHEVSSDHFVILADDKEADIRQFAENLERYHSALAFLTGEKSEKPSPSNRVTIFVVGGRGDMRELAGGKRSVGGFYIPRAGASRAFVQDIRNQKGYPHFSTIIMLHEYAHHFLISSARLPMPRWLNEGAAEFFAAATFNDDGSVLIGRAAQHRGGELAYAKPVHVRELLEAPGYSADGNGRNAFYGKSWLLYHYLTFSKERGGQIGQYQINLFNGMSSIAAGEAAFGDLDKLERELTVYLRGGRFMMVSLGADKLSSGSAITVRKLPPGEAEVMPLVIRSQRGVNREEALEILPDVRAIAARYPNDAGVLAALAEAEYDAGNDAEAIAAADRAIAADKSRTNAYVQKGFALFRQAGTAQDKLAAYEAAMKPFEALNAIENDHPLPLMYFYRSFAERGATPPENARAALEYASRLAPFDQGLQLNAGMMLIKEGKFEIARDFLNPVAANPHGGGASERAKQLLEGLAKAPLEATLDIPALPREGNADAASEAGE